MDAPIPGHSGPGAKSEGAGPAIDQLVVEALLERPQQGGPGSKRQSSGADPGEKQARTFAALSRAFVEHGARLW